MKNLLLLFCFALGLGSSGCNSMSGRISEKSAVYNTLDAATQTRLKQGLVDVGYSTDMVYIALGKPDETSQRLTDKGNETEWIYKNYWQEYQGTRFVGYHRIMYYDPQAKAYRVYYEPVRTEVYRNRVEDRTRISFLDGKVTTIEQAKS